MVPEYQSINDMHQADKAVGTALGDSFLKELMDFVARNETVGDFCLPQNPALAMWEGTVDLAT